MDDSVLQLDKPLLRSDLVARTFSSLLPRPSGIAFPELSRMQYICHTRHLLSGPQARPGYGRRNLVKGFRRVLKGVELQSTLDTVAVGQPVFSAHSRRRATVVIVCASLTLSTKYAWSQAQLSSRWHSSSSAFSPL